MSGDISAPEQEPESGPGPARVGTPAEFVAELNRLRAWAGQPSLRRLEKLSGRPLGNKTSEPLPSSTTSEILAGKRLPRLPRLEFVEAFVAACLQTHELDDDTVEHMVNRWRAAWRAVEIGGETKPAPPDLAPVRRLRTRFTPANLVVLVAVFAAGALVGVAGTRLVQDDVSDSPSTPATTSTRPAASQQCRPLDEPHARGLVAMGPPGTPPVGEGNTVDWWVNIVTVGLTTTADGFKATVPAGATTPSALIVIRSGITLTAGHRYRFDFTATADHPVVIQVRIQVRIQDKTPPQYQPSLVESVPISTTACRRAYTFTVSTTSLTTGEVTFQLGGQGAYTLTINDPVLIDTST